ncbi:eCIS core domain-containing protein [Streptomyces sp. RGM 3693]|uniref:eCIS core domain-containing protein n=1 Tax=Streptomyces sp. RGM 3693 TaxID=3413284 RepID=UPI003D2D3304
MSSSARSAAQDGQSARDERRRKRKERSARSAAPEPKRIVSGAGQPLDLSVRRELEEQLGHDFSQVRLHTDRDSGQLAELMGADAFAVGQDIFFRAGTYRPGTADGQRLLAHELLHTVQNPHGLGALRAGRDLGAVSLPQETVEREAESAAQESVRSAMLGAVRAAEPAAEIEPGQATPGWLRYATVDADRRRRELIDPATLVDRLANGVLRSLRGDPEDRSKRARMQLAQLPDELQDAVLERLERRLLSSEHERVLDLVAEIEADEDLERGSLDAPVIETDPAEALRFTRESEWRAAAEQREQEQKPGLAPGPEKDEDEAAGATGSTPRNGGTREDGTTPQGGGTPGGPVSEGGNAGPEQRRGGGGSSPGPAAGAPGAAPAQQAPESAPAAPGGQPADRAAADGGQSTGGTSADGQSSRGQSSDGQSSDSGQGAGQQAGGKTDAGADGKEGTEREGTPVASKEESAAKNRPGAVDALVAGKQLNPADKRGQEKPSGSPSTAGAGAQQPGAVSTLDGVRTQDLEGPQTQADEDPFGAGSESEVDVGGEEPSAWDVTLQPDDYLPAQDLDVSAVPTADQLDPSSSGSPAAPSFPAPPVTKADKVQAERAAEDAEDATADAGPEEDVDDGPVGAGASTEADGAGPDDGPDDGLAADRAADARTAPGTASKDPKSGADPKAGPVAAQVAVQVAVQEAPGRPEGGGAAQEQAAKEEKGTPAAGDASGAGQEKSSPQAAGGESAAAGAAGGGEQQKAEAAPADKGAPAGGAQTSSPGRDSHVSGGSNADASGGASADAAAGARREPSGEGTGARTEEPAARTEGPAQKGAPAGAQHGAGGAAPSAKAAPEAPAADAPAPAAKEERAPEAAARPAPAAQGAGGGGGGGGSAAVPVKKAKKDSGPAPNLSNVSPEAGLSTASKLKPHKALEAMGGVGGAVDRTVGDEHKALAAAPPSMQRPAGAPQTLQGQPKTDAPAQYDQNPAQKSDAPNADKAEVTGAKEPEGQIEAEKAEDPSGWQTFKMALGFGLGTVAGWFGFKVDKQELAAKFAGLPTKDEALKKAQAGNAPGVQMQGAAGAKADEQGGAVDAKGQDTVATGRDDAGRSMGEDQVYPDAPKEQMAAKVPGAQGGKGGGPQGAADTGAVPPDAASEVAEHERGPQFQAAFGDGQKSMSQGREKKDQDFRDSQEKHKKQVDAEIDGNTKSQADERDKAMGEVTDHRSDWRKEQDTELKKLGDKKSDRHDKVRKDVKDKEEKTDKDTTKEKEDGDKQIQDKNTTAENDAKKKRDDSVNESGNWLSEGFDWIKNKVIEIKNAIVDVIKRARDAVVGFIKHFKETVERWINEARQYIADAITTLINDLIQFAKDMVRAVIEIALRIRKLIAQLISDAIALVNKLATMLKKALSDLLDAIGKLLSGILDILKQVLDEAVKQVIGAIKGVLDFASKLLSALGDWMLIAVDFLSDPGGWLSGAKNSAVDGAKNHLFREISTAVKQWFKDKIQEIIGVPKAILDKLLNGGFKLDDIVKEAWEAVLPQLPLIIGELVMTKIVAKLIPGAGWVMAVIDAIRTAWGALSAILRALSMVLDWLKAVRAGGAGILFAKAVAAGVVALLETLYQWLLNGIGKYVAKVGQRLKGVAARLGKGFGKEGRGGPKGAAGEGGGGKGDRTGGKKPQSADAPSKEPAPKSAGAPATRPTTAKPHETTPGEKPGEKPGAGKPTSKPGETPERPTAGKPKSPADEPKKPTGNDKNGKPKTTADEKPDTRPTPSPKPKPEPEPRPKAKQDPESTPKPKEDSPTKPTDKEPTKPKGNENPGTKPKEDPHDPNKPNKPNKPKEEDPTKPKPGKEDDHPRKPGDKHPSEDPKKPKNKPDKDHDPKKPKEGDNKKPKHQPDEKGPHKPKEDHPKGKDPNKEKQDKKDKKKEDENKKDSKDARLAKIVAKLRPRLQRMLHKGTKGSAHKVALSSMRLWYRLTELNMLGSRTFEDEAVLNPRKMVINGKELDSEPILRYVRDMERMILSKAGQPGQTTGNELNGQTETGPSGSDRRHLDIPNLDIARVVALLKKEKTTTQIWNWGTEQIHRTRLGGWYLRKFRGGKTLPEQGEGTTTYADIESRILAAGAEREASEALASTPGANRTLGPRHISSDIALHNSLSYFVERDRNPGNMVMSTLQTDLFAQSLKLSGDARRKWFRQVFGMNTMSPQGAPKGGTLLKKKKYLNNVGTIEKEIDTETRKAKNRGYSSDILSDPLKIRADIERQISTEIAKLPENLQGNKKGLSKVRNRVERSNKDLVKLESLHHGNSLAEREIRLIEEWVKIQASDIDVSDAVTEEQVQEQLKAKIRERLEMRYPYIREVP